ncbi:FAD-binding protein [Streptomyces sp. NPDC002172]
MSSLGHQLTTSVLVVGSGASGLRAAIEVAEADVAVVVVTQRAREDPGRRGVGRCRVGARPCPPWRHRGAAFG